MALDNLLKSSGARSMDALSCVVRELGVVVLHGPEAYLQLQRSDREGVPDMDMDMGGIRDMLLRGGDGDRGGRGIGDNSSSRAGAARIQMPSGGKAPRECDSKRRSSNNTDAAVPPSYKGSRLGTVSLPKPLPEDLDAYGEYDCFSGTGSDVPSSESGSDENVSTKK
jgi:hypothetical protein